MASATARVSSGGPLGRKARSSITSGRSMTGRESSCSVASGLPRCLLQSSGSTVYESSQDELVIQSAPFELRYKIAHELVK